MAYSDSGVWGSAAVNALLMKTLVETAMAGEKQQTKNELKVAGAMATETGDDESDGNDDENEGRRWRRWRRPVMAGGKTIINNQLKKRWRLR